MSAHLPIWSVHILNKKLCHSFLWVISISVFDDRRLLALFVYNVVQKMYCRID